MPLAVTDEKLRLRLVNDAFRRRFLDSDGDPLGRELGTLTSRDERLRGIAKHLGHVLAAPGDMEPQTLEPLAIDPLGRQATRDGTPLVLSPEEFALLATLAARPGYACPAPLLLEQVWGQGSRDNQALLAEAIAHLRALVEPDPSAPSILGGSLSQGFWLGGISHERELNGG